VGGSIGHIVRCGGTTVWWAELLGEGKVHNIHPEIEKQSLTRLKTNGHNMTILKNTGIPHLALLIGSRKTEH
jgi:hypothetical protein